MLITIKRGLILAILAIMVGGALAAGRPGTVPVSEDPPELIIDDSVGADFQGLALQTWDQFLAVFWSRKDCFGDVYLRAAHVLGSRAVYDPDSATVTVRVPATAAMLQAALVHEWAHHLEFQCRQHEDLREAFLNAQVLPKATRWRMSDTPGIAVMTWPDLPSEQYAESVVALVLGGRSIPTGAHVSIEAVRVIESWAAGDSH